jgi:hypothetical protein
MTRRCGSTLLQQNKGWLTRSMQRSGEAAARAL